jgi:hypothetical protein
MTTNNSNNTNNIEDVEKEFGINDVCALLGLSRVYVHRMILKGKLESVKRQIGNNTYKHFVKESELNRWRASVGQRTHREDGRMKFNLYANAAEIEKIQELLKNESIESIIARANKVKEIENV